MVRSWFLLFFFVVISYFQDNSFQTFMNKEITNHLSVIAKFAGIVVPALLIIVSVILNTAYR